MATSTFGKHFAVEQKEASKFVKAMSTVVPPTLTKQFKSSYTNLATDNTVREKLTTLLGK